MSDDRDIEVLYDKALAATRTKRTKGATVEKRSRIPTEREYETAERMRANREEEEINKLPLHERKENQAELLDAMKTHPETIGERIDWLIGGSYGKGQYDIAREILRGKRLNREAILMQMIAVYEWRVPRRMSRDAWNKLSQSEKKRLSDIIQKEIRDAEEAIKEEG